ncbi:MAG: ion transporter [Deltaproteobacteria bacterium]|nr:ion transporter [Deltaproteobacteria bacterium]
MERAKQNFARRLTESPAFQRAVAGVIVFCAGLVGFERTTRARTIPQSYFDAADLFFGCVFLVELLLRFWADGPRRFFTLWRLRPRAVGQGRFSFARLDFDEHGFWNYFDATIVIASFLTLFGHLFEHPEFLFVVRLFRIFRVLRLLEVSDKMRIIEKRIVAVIPTVFTFIMLLGILVYIYAVLGSHLFGDDSVSYFATADAAFLTMFQILTLDGWSEVMRSLLPTHPWLAPMYFISFIMLTAIISLNVFIAALGNEMEFEMAKEMTDEMRPELVAIEQLERRILTELSELKDQMKRRS